jgi:superfamily I DNA and/or RNA helicase/very-short-patch-repair endonuclease
MAEQISQIKFDKNFIKKLLEKLKVGNTRSIHLNALPGRFATRLDVFELSKIDIKKEVLSSEQISPKEKNTPERFIETLLNNDSFSFYISYDGIDLGEFDEDEKKKLSLLSKRLDTLVIENNDNFLEYGIKNFGFGFPLLIKRDRNDPSKIIKAPLIIWHLDIERSYQNKNTWTIEKDEDSPIKLNELLISHLSKDESVKLEKIPKEVLEDGILDEEELLELCQNILSQLSSESEKMKVKIEKCPDKKTIESISNSNTWIQWSGVFGIYRSQKETIIQATEELLEKAAEFEDEDLILEKFQTSTITAVETDPSKEEIINTLTKNEIKLIQGPPGTGKSQSITAIVSNALANEARCLIVCEKKTALDVIQANLEKMGLGDFSVVIDDVNKDRKKVIQKARDINENLNYSPFSKHNFEDKYKKFCYLKKELNEKYSESLKVVFGDFSWKQLIGLYLRFSKSDNYQDFQESLSYDFLEFNHQEYAKYLNIIEEASYLYEDLEQDSEIVFSKLCNGLFVEEYKWGTHEKVKIETNNFLEVLKSFNSFLSEKNQNDCEEKRVSLFKPDSIENSKDITENLITHLKELQILYRKGLELVGDSFNEKGSLRDFSFSIYSVFTSKYKEVYKIRKEIPQLLAKIRESIANIEKFGFDNLEIKPFEEYESLRTLIEDISQLLKEIRIIQSKIEEIENFRFKIQAFESNLKKCVSNKTFEFSLKNHIELDNFKEVSHYFSNLESEISKIKDYFDAYESFHNWKFFELKRDKKENRILAAFKNIPTDEWKNIFKAWYYHGALFNFEENSKTGFNKSDTKLQQLSSLFTELKELQLGQIKHIWKNKIDSEMLSFSHNFNALYNLRKNKTFGRRNSLRKVIETDLDLFTTLFPVILTNPSVVNALFPLKPGLFEIVIFDEASQLRVSDTFTSLIRGQYKIIAGDKHQMPPSNYFLNSSESLDIDDQENDEAFTSDDEQVILAESESLLQYAEDLKEINKSYLDFHYRSEHPALIEFSNAAFYGGNLVPFPEQDVYKPIDFRSVNGRYESRTNPKEIAEIVKILREEIHPDQKGKYPSIGVATFNINQRNLIIESFNKIAEEDISFAQKLQELKEKGLFVKNLENIQGDERDIIIISTTYGVKPDGKFSQNFARLNRIEGYKLLNVLITRAKKKVYVCTSIPKEKYLGYSEIIQNEGNNKKGILYAYLAYAEAVSNHDNKTAESILRILKEQSFETPRVISQNEGLSESPFEEEVYEELLEYFDKEYVIQQHKVGGFRLDFVVKIGEKNIVLECDGKAYHQSDEAYAHDMFRQKELENMGFIVYRIWSTNWFQDKEREMQKFLNFIRSLDNK